MAKNIVIVFLSIVGIVLTVFLARPRPPDTAPTPTAVTDSDVVTDDRAEDVARLEKQLAERDAEVARLRAKLTARTDESEMDMLIDDLTADDTVAAVSNEVASGISDAIQQIMSAFQGTNSGLQDIMGSAFGRPQGLTHKQRVALYDDLVKDLGLDDEKAAAFRELLEKKYGSSGITMNINGVETQAIGLGDLLGGGSATDDAMRDLLGDDAYAAYEQFAEKDSSRFMVGEFDQYLGEKGQSLTAEQRGRLTDMFHQAKLADPTGQDLDDGLSFQLESDTPLDTKVDQSLDSLVTRYDALAESATDVLSAQESEQFRGFLDNKLQQKEMEGDLARRLLSETQILQGVPGADVRGSVKVISPGVSVGVISGSSSEMTIDFGQDGQGAAEQETP